MGEPKENIKKPAKKNIHFVYFYGSENYGWIQEDNIYPYPQFKSKYEEMQKLPKGFKEALETIESEHQAKLVCFALSYCATPLPYSCYTAKTRDVYSSNI